VYKEIYYLTTKIGIGDPIYIESLTPMERKLYINYFLKDQEEKRSKERGNVFDATSSGAPMAGMNLAGDLTQNGNTGS